MRISVAQPEPHLHSVFSSFQKEKKRKEKKVRTNQIGKKSFCIVGCERRHDFGDASKLNDQAKYEAITSEAATRFVGRPSMTSLAKLGPESATNGWPVPKAL